MEFGEFLRLDEEFQRSQKGMKDILHKWMGMRHRLLCQAVLNMSSEDLIEDLLPNEVE